MNKMELEKKLMELEEELKEKKPLLSKPEKNIGENSKRTTLEEFEVMDALDFNNYLLFSKKSYGKNFFRGSLFTFYYAVWPPILLVFLMHDWFVFSRRPNERYNTTGLDIFAGAAENQATWSANLGTNSLHDAKYWLGFVTLITMPVITGLISTPFRFAKYNQMLKNGMNDLVNNPNNDPKILRFIKLFTFSVYTSYAIFATYRYGRIIAKKSHEINQHNKNKENCIKKEFKRWQYLPQISDYDCSVCGDWSSFVYLGDINSAQSCLDGLLNSSKNISAYIANGNLTTLAGYEKITRLDLSRRAIAEWDEVYFKDVFDNLAAISNFQVFNLSTANFNIAWPVDSRAEYLRNFLQKYKIEIIDLSGQGLDANQIRIILSGINKQFLRQLYLARNNLHNEGLMVVKDFLQGSNVSIIDVSYNYLSSPDMDHFFAVLPNSRSKEIYFKGAFFDQAGFDAFSGNVTQSGIKLFDISDCNLAGIDASVLGESLHGSQIVGMIINRCELNAGHANDLAPHLQRSKLQRLSVEDNKLLDEGGIILIEGAQNSSITEINIKQNYLRNYFVDSTAEYFYRSKIENINVGGNLFANSKIDKFLNYLPTSISHINIANTVFDDSNLETLKSLQANSTYHLQAVDVSYTSITDAGILSYVPLIENNTPVLALYFRGTYITNIGIKPFFNALAKNKYLRVLDFSDTYFTQEVGEDLANALAKSNELREIYFDNIAVGDKLSKALAAKLTRPNTDIDRLASYDEKHQLNHAQPATNLAIISMKNCNIPTESAKALCQVLPHTKCTPSQLNLHNNPIDTAQIDLDSCVISSAERIKPWSMIMPFAKMLTTVPELLVNPFFNEQANTNRFIPPPPLSAVNIADTHHLLANNQKVDAKTAYHSPDLTGTFYLGLFVIAKIRALLPSYFLKAQFHSPTPEERCKLDNFKKSIISLQNAVHAQAESDLGRSAIFAYLLVFCTTTLTSLLNNVEEMRKRQMVSQTAFSDIEAKLQRVQIRITQHAQANEQYLHAKQCAVESKQKTGKESIVILKRDGISGKLSHTITDTPLQQNKASKWQPNFFQKVIKQIPPLNYLLGNSTDPMLPPETSLQKVFNL